MNVKLINRFLWKYGYKRWKTKRCIYNKRSGGKYIGCKWRKQDTFYKNSAHKNVCPNDKKFQSAQNISPKVALTRLAVGGTTSCRWWLQCPGGALGDTRHRRSPVPVTWTPPHLLLVFLLLLLLFLFFYPIFLPPYRISHGPFIFSFAILPF